MPLRPLLLVTAGLALASVLGPPLSAQTFVYALNQKGALTVNGTEIDDLPSSFDEDDPIDTDSEQRWWAMYVRGSDRYALRLDGRLNKNGVKLYQLNDEDDTWIDLAVTADDDVWALRQDGRLSRNNTNVGDLTAGSFGFTAQTTDGVSAYSLRADGAVYRDNITTKLFAFTAGNFEGDGEGESSATTWVAIEVNPVDGQVYALRRDGSVVRGDPTVTKTPDDGVVVAKLPIGNQVDSSSAYVSLSFDETGRWWALRGSGRVYNSDDVFTDLVDLPGDPSDDDDQAYIEIVGGTDNFVALRSDGNLYDNAATLLVNLVGDGYRALAASLEAPDLTNTQNAKPKIAGYKVKLVTGDDLVLPIVVTDTDALPDDLVVTVDESLLPAGATYDSESRTFSWAGAGPAGGYKLQFTVDDGVSKPVKGSYSVKIKDPDTNRAKNQAPKACKISSVQALVGFPLVLQIVVSDRDGDALVVSADETQAPFTLGASFDPETLVFTWPDPQLTEVGKYTLSFQVTDGIKTTKFKVKIKLVSSILAF